MLIKALAWYFFVVISISWGWASGNVILILVGLGVGVYPFISDIAKEEMSPRGRKKKKEHHKREKEIERKYGTINYYHKDRKD